MGISLRPDVDCTGDVRAWGAVGDGVADDSAAIRAALNAAPVVTLPPGTFVVSPTEANSRILLVPAGRRIVGAGRGITTIKVRSGSLPYRALIEALSADDLDISGITFDSNVAGNAVANLSELMSGGPRFTISAQGDRIAVRDCEILNSTGVNDINIGGDRVSIRGCWWRACGDDPNHVVHDASSIYISGTGAIVEANHFEGVALNAPGAMTAIEMHGTQHAVRSNVVDRYAGGINLTGIWPGGDSRGVQAIGNVITNAAVGIQLWSRALGDHQSGYGLDGALVLGNMIDLAPAGTWSRLCINYVHGILFDVAADLEMRGIRVVENRITHPPEAELFAGNSASIGIGWWNQLGNGTLTDCEISRNSVVGFPMAGIRLSGVGTAIADVRVRGNYLRDCGSSLDTSITAAYRSPIFMSVATMAGAVRFEDNIVIDALGRNDQSAYLQCPLAQRGAFSQSNNIGTGFDVWR